jgi:S-adenosyl-L-methionine hydrolase (adenosine-forming)
VSPRVVTLLTDYGPHSEHVGALHAVLVGADPGIVRVDFAHDIPRGDIRFGAVVLERLATRLPHAVHLAVVDPGVGSGRRGLAVRLADGGCLVGPDNGLLGPVAVTLGAVAAAELPAHPGAAATFDGRDVFAPAAARLAGNEEFERLGTPVDPAGIMHVRVPRPEVTPGQLQAEILGCDRFGNVQLAALSADAQAAGLLAGLRAEITGPAGQGAAVVARTFDDAAPGVLVVYLDSHGHVAVAENRGDAATRLGAHPGGMLTLTVTSAPVPYDP